MTTKDELVSSIKEWIRLEDEMKVLQSELKSRRVQKKMLSDNLVDVMKNNEIDCFDLAGGKLMYSSNKVKAPLSKKYLLDSLQSYFGENPHIDSNDVAEYVLENREVKIKECVRHKPQK
jgi:hypothetical protein|tara:strand:+ start:1040 stop:1396 length:357 start_codon:yes stop_codon:yes gene_type:complete